MSRRATSSAQISLFPFLSILVCLIGGLVILIVVLTVFQGSAAESTDPEMRQRVLAAATMRSQIRAAEAELALLQAEISKLKIDSSGLGTLEDKADQLRKELAAVTKPPTETSAALQKLLETMLAQLESMARETPPLQQEIARLNEELKKRQMKPDAQAPALVVRSSGSGMAAQSKLFFVETSAAGLALHSAAGEITRISAGSIDTDAQYNQFLANAKKTPDASVIFLLRPDGSDTYNLAAGWAEAQYQLKTGKLPLPGAGAVDLTQFGFKKAP